MNSGIYRIRNIINNKFYLGSSKNIKGRWKVHKQSLRENSHHSPYLQNSWNKYGKENFLFEIIECVEPDYLLVREQFYLDLWEPHDPKIGYNVCQYAYSCVGIFVGEKHPQWGKHLTEQQKEHLRFLTAGENNEWSCFSMVQINEIRNTFIFGISTFGEFSKKWNVSPSCIERIVKNKTYVDLNYQPIILKAKPTRTKRKVSNEIITEMIKMRKNGVFLKDIAKTFSISITHTSRLVNV